MKEKKWRREGGREEKDLIPCIGIASPALDGTANPAYPVQCIMLKGVFKLRSNSDLK